MLFVSYIFTILPTCLVFSVYWTIKKKLIVRPLSMTLAKHSPTPVSDIYETLPTLAQLIFIILKISSTPLATNFREIYHSF